MDAYGCDCCRELKAGSGKKIEVCPGCLEMLQSRRGEVQVVIGAGEVTGRMKNGRVHLSDAWVNANVRGRR